MITSCTGEARKLRFGEKNRKSQPFLSNNLWIDVRTSGDWGEATADNDFDAFLCKKIKLLLQLNYYTGIVSTPF